MDKEIVYVSYKDGRWEIKVDDIIVFSDVEFFLYKESPSVLVRRLLDSVGVRYTGVSGETKEKRFIDIYELFNYMENYNQKTNWIPNDNPRSLRVGFLEQLSGVLVSISFKDIDKNIRPKFEERFWREEFCKRINQLNELKYPD